MTIGIAFIAVAALFGIATWVLRQEGSRRREGPGPSANVPAPEVPAPATRELPPERTLRVEAAPIVAEPPRGFERPSQSWAQSAGIDAAASADSNLRLDMIARLAVLGQPWCAEILRAAASEEHDPNVARAAADALRDLEGGVLGRPGAGI